MNARSDYTAGLRALADLLDANPDVPLPSRLGRDFSWAVFGSKVPTGQKVPVALADLARTLIPGVRNKRADDGYFRVSGKLHGLNLEVWAMREAVCTRVVTGTETVTRGVLDAAALAAVPTTTVTETVETVEWVCAPLLADEVSA